MSRRGIRVPRITEAQVLALVKAGKYVINPTTAEVTGPKDRLITPHPCGCTNRSKGTRMYVRIYGFGGVRTIALARLVWLSVTRETLPGPHWEVHHRDESNSSDGWDNLIALHKLDHRKLHAAEAAGEPF